MIQYIVEKNKLLMNLLVAGSFLLATSLLAGCSKYLEQQPDNRTDLDTPEKVSQLLTSAYPSNDYITFCEALSDNSADRERAAHSGAGDLRVNEDIYHFKDLTSTAEGSSDVYWQSCYTAIAAANQALQACNTAANPAAYSASKGEALLARAYAHFMLVTFFSKVYDPATAASDPGIPYVTSPETTLYKQYDRKTVSYVYDMIEKDITQGIPLLDDKSYQVPAYRFTKAAGHAFAARFYLFKQQYDSVIKHASLVFPDNNFAPNLRQLNGSLASQSQDARVADYTKSTEKANLLLATTSSAWGGFRGWFLYRYGLTYDLLIQLFYSGSVAGGSLKYDAFPWGNNLNDCGIYKFKEDFIYTSANVGNAYIFVPLLTAEEALFNRAEAYALSGQYDLSMNDLNVFISKRIDGYDAGTNNLTAAKVTDYYQTGDPKQALIETILDFKRSEFVQEGMRWLDILRYKLPVTHKDNLNGDIATTVLQANDPRRVLQIPQSAQFAGITANPR